MTKEDFIQWRHNSVTEEVFEWVREAREAYVRRLISGATLDSMTETAKVVATVQAFDYMLNIEHEGDEA